MLAGAARRDAAREAVSRLFAAARPRAADARGLPLALLATSQSRFLTLPSNIEQLLIRIPKGFGGRPGRSSAEKEDNNAVKDGKEEGSEDSKSGGSGGNASGSGGGGDKKGDKKDKKDSKKEKEDKEKEDKRERKEKKEGSGSESSEQMREYVMGALAAGALTYFVYTFFLAGGGEGPEISWQEFRNTLLATGLVDRLEVVNREYVRVYLRRHPSQAFLAAAAGSAAGGAGSAGAGGSSTGFGADGMGGSDDVAAALGMSLPPQLEAELRKGMATAARVGAGRPLHFRIGSVDSFERQLEDAQLELGVKPRDFVLLRHVSEADRTSGLLSALPTLIMIGLLMGVGRGMAGGVGGMGGGGKDGMSRIFGIGKARPTVVNKDTKVKVTFKDVAGADEAKAEVMEFVQFLKDPSRFTNLGAKIPKGALLVGPPGTGKTLLAKATAGEAGVPFFSMSGSDFIEMFVGVGPSRVRDLFAQARAAAPCMIFIDEIDAVARARNKGGFGGGNEERENTLNQLLVEMDGFATTEGVVVLAGTNRVDILDKAILRPGRFDRQIQVDRPDIKGRRDIFMVHMKAIKLAGDAEAYAQRLAALTPGFVGADIHNICNEAAIQAARKAKTAVDMKDFEAAIDRVIGGLERRNGLMSPEERRTIAYHEAGHAIAGWFLEHADPLLKVTIIPRGSGALGFAQYLPKEVALYTREALLDRMAMALGGRAAEEVSFGRITTGASDDLDKVTQIAYAMTAVYGMTPRLGQLSFPKKEENQFEKPYSDATAELIDEEARAIVDAAYARVKELLDSKKEALRGVAELLLERETINQNDLARIAGPRPFPINPKLKEYVESMFDEPEPSASAGAKDKAKEEEEGKDKASSSGSESGSGSGSGASSSAGSGSGADAGAGSSSGSAEGKKEQAAADKFSAAVAAASGSPLRSRTAAALRAMASVLEPPAAAAASAAAAAASVAAAVPRSLSRADLQAAEDAGLRPAFLPTSHRQLR